MALSALDLLPGSRALAAATTATSTTSRATPSAAVAPFTLGVASGDPLPRSVVLWTRLADDPTDGGQMGDRGVRVDWEVATDERFARVVQRGTALAGPEFGHSVHVNVQGLRPAA